MATLLVALGNVFKNKGEDNKALQYYQKSLQIREKALGLDHHRVAMSLNNIGSVFYDKGKYDNALQHFQKSLAIWEKALGLDHPRVVYSLNGIGAIFIAQKKPKLAIEPLERLAAICEKKTCDSVAHGHGLFDLARALVVTGGDKGRAFKLAKQAREEFGKTPQALQNEIKEVDAWLKKHERATP